MLADDSYRAEETMRTWTHTHLLAVLLASVLALTACSQPPEPDAGFTWVTAEDFAAELARVPAPDARPLTIVDVREPELYAEGHIPGAINMPWPEVKDIAAAQLPKDHAIVMVCHGGPMGDEVAERLVAAGFTDVRNLAGGMRKWQGPVTPGG
jgi:rhodanese-related sulfurtransferase